MLHCHRQEREGQISPLGGQSGILVIMDGGGGRDILDILDMAVVVIFWI